MLKASYVLAAAVAVAAFVPILLAVSHVGPEIGIGGEQSVGTYDNAESTIRDAGGDAVAVYQKTGSVRNLVGFHGCSVWLFY